MRHAPMTALALVLGLAALPALAQSDTTGQAKASAAITGCIQAGAQVSAEAFNALDDNGDGFIAQQEYIEKCGKAGASADGDDAARAHFASLDADRDQKLSQDEFKAPAMKRSDAGSASGSAATSGQSRVEAQGSVGSPPGVPTTNPPTASDRSLSADRPSASSTTSGASSTPPSAAPSGLAITGAQAEEVIGREVVNAKGDEIGEIKDLVLDRQQVAHAVVSVGGFLGIGAKDVAVPFEQLRIGADNVILMSETSEAELKQMPEYKKDQYSPVQREPARRSAPASQPKQ
jgi:sporulation protein YlmC with PRC-barrel domain